MTALHILALVVFVVAAAALLIRYVHAVVDGEFRSLARAVSDREFRGGELARIDRLLKGLPSVPSGIKPLAGPESGARKAFPPLLLAVGIILLWGGLFAREEARLWLGAGLAATLLAAALMLLALRRRKWERLARLLRFRADLRRLDGDQAGSASDLRSLIAITPWDDAAWAELSDDLAARGDLDGALDAVRQAGRLDPRYDEYRMLEASLAIRTGRLDMAREAIAAWMKIAPVREDDPRRVIYQAAIDLAEGNRERAADALREVALDGDGRDYEFLDTDQALRGVRDLLPGRE